MSTKAATDAGTTKSSFKPYQYKVERHISGAWRALYAEDDESSWRPVRKDFDYGWHEYKFMFKFSAIKACKKHAENRRRSFYYKNEAPIYLGEM